MNQLLPDRLKDLWRAVKEKTVTGDDAWAQQERWMDEYRATWTRALLLDGQSELKQSILAELGQYVGCADAAEVERRCVQAHKAVAREWQAIVNPDDSATVADFYNRSKAELYGLAWWHTLVEDSTPLAYVLALEFAQQHGCRQYADYGSGVGSSGVLFARAGFEVTLADIASPLLRFCGWRMAQRGLPVWCIDLKTDRLPARKFDFVTAMDVFEHLTDPVGAAEHVCAALKPGGFLFGRLAVEAGDHRPGHVVDDLKPTLRRMTELGLEETWRDEWLWGHQAFRKAR